MRLLSSINYDKQVVVNVSKSHGTFTLDIFQRTFLITGVVRYSRAINSETFFRICQQRTNRMCGATHVRQTVINSKLFDPFRRAKTTRIAHKIPVFQFVFDGLMTHNDLIPTLTFVLVLCRIDHREKS